MQLPSEKLLHFAALEGHPNVVLSQNIQVMQSF